MRADEARLLLAERTPTVARTESAPSGTLQRPGPSGAFSDREPIAEEALPGDVFGETTSVTRTPEEDLALPGEPPGPGEARPRADGTPPRRTEPDGASPGPGGVPSGRTEAVPPSRTEEVPTAEEVPSGIPPQAPPGDVQRGTASKPPPATADTSRVEEERAGQEESEEDRGLVDRAREYLRGEGRERDYLRGE